MVKGRPPFSTWRCSNSRRIQRLSFPQPDYGTLGIYTQMVFETRKRPTVRSLYSIAMNNTPYAMNSSYAMLPVVLHKIRSQECTESFLRKFLHQAKSEVIEKDQRFLEARTRYFLQLRSRRERLQVEPCFEAEEAALLYSRLALEALESYVKGGKPAMLGEALYNFEASERMFPFVSI